MKTFYSLLATVVLGIILFSLYYQAAHAEVYIGVGAAVAITDVETECPDCTHYDVQKQSIKPTAFLGYRISNTAVEAGLGYAAYRGHAVVPTRPADVRQEIDARFVYLAAIQFFPMVTGEFFAGAGVAKVYARNHEHGLTQDVQGNTGQVTNQTYTKELAPYFEAGYQLPHLRLSASIVPNVVRSPWTGSQDIYQFSATYVWRK